VLLLLLLLIIIIILFIMVKTQRSTSQQSVTQDIDYIPNAYTVTQHSHNKQV